MLFTDEHFLFSFLPLALLLHRVALNWGGIGKQYPNSARLCLFILTLFFYGYEEPWWLIPFGICIGFDFLWASLLTRTTEPRVRKRWVVFSVIQNLGLLALFKYWNFICENLAGFGVALPPLTYEGTALSLPPGISFYVFESLSFVIDVYRRHVQPPKNPLEFFSFIGMFPRFIAGPIVRYRDMVRQFDHYRGMQLEAGLYLFILGFFTKVCLADSFEPFVAYAFDRREMFPIGAAGAWVGSLAYTMQIYFDFSGYSLMAIGLGRCLGFQFPTNFRQPYLASSLQDFWRRWHITLSTWLRDYVYFSLGGSRQGKWKTYRNLMLTMTLGGLWHGSSWTFVLWGVWHGAGLCIERALSEKQRFKVAPFWGNVSMFLFVLLGWIWFRSSSLAEMRYVVTGLVRFHEPMLGFTFERFYAHPISALFCVFGLWYAFYLERKWNVSAREILPQISLRRRFVAATLMAVALVTVFSNQIIPFLYFQF